MNIRETMSCKVDRIVARRSDPMRLLMASLTRGEAMPKMQLPPIIKSETPSQPMCKAEPTLTMKAMAQKRASALCPLILPSRRCEAWLDAPPSVKPTAIRMPKKYSGTPSAR